MGSLPLDTPFSLSFQSVIQPAHLWVLLAARAVLLALAFAAFARTRSPGFGVWTGALLAQVGAVAWTAVVGAPATNPTPGRLPEMLLSPVALELAGWALFYGGLVMFLVQAVRMGVPITQVRRDAEVGMGTGAGAATGTGARERALAGIGWGSQPPDPAPRGKAADDEAGV